MRRVAGIALAVVMVAGCGRSPGMPDEVAAELRDRVATIRTAAAGGNRAGAEAALAELRRRVAELRQTKTVEDGRAVEILGAAAEVETQLALLPAPPPPPPPTTTTATTQLQDEWNHRGKKKDRGHGDDD